VLRPMTLDDVDDIYSYQSREDVCRYLSFEPRSRGEVAAKVADYAKALVLSGDGDFWQLAIERAGEPGAPGGPLRRGPVVQGRVGGHSRLRDPRSRVGRAIGLTPIEPRDRRAVRKYGQPRGGRSSSYAPMTFLSKLSSRASRDPAAQRGSRSRSPGSSPANAERLDRQRSPGACRGSGLTHVARVLQLASCPERSPSVSSATAAARSCAHSIAESRSS